MVRGQVVEAIHRFPSTADALASEVQGVDEVPQRLVLLRLGGTRDPLGTAIVEELLLLLPIDVLRFVGDRLPLSAAAG